MIQEKTTYRYLANEDIDIIINNFLGQGWHKERKTIENYILDQEKGNSIVIVAEIENDIAGYITLIPEAQDAITFVNKKIPEIKDFVVFEKYQSQGIGNKLLELIETEAANVANEVCLGVGLHSGYGAAQRLYIKRGFIPDGTGIWSGNELALPYSMIKNDDELVMFLSKKLKK